MSRIKVSSECVSHMLERVFGKVRGHMCCFLAAGLRLAEVTTVFARQINIRNVSTSTV